LFFGRTINFFFPQEVGRFPYAVSKKIYWRCDKIGSKVAVLPTRSRYANIPPAGLPSFRDFYLVSKLSSILSVDFGLPNGLLQSNSTTNHVEGGIIPSIQELREYYIFATMAAPNSLRSLLRPSTGPTIASRTQPVVPIVTWTAFFSTSAAANAAANKPPAVGMGRHLRRGKHAQISSKKKRDGTKAKKPLPGERKAFRKRIQLSNSNALPVQGLSDIEATTMLDAASSGRMFGLPDQVVDKLRALEAFKTTQSWGLFRRPHVLVRSETLDLVKRMQDVVEKKKTLGLVLTGERSTGKSLMLLQAMAHSLQNNWVVINIPEGGLINP
jgi:hypothetical protein